jgi:hypothetical protein
MRYLVSVMLLIVGVIHLLPLSGMLGIERLSALYGLSFNDPNLVILMRHRAVLFGLLGLFFMVAAFRPELQILAFIAGFISVISFIWLAYSVGAYNAKISRILMMDIIALVCLVVASATHVYLKSLSKQAM